MDDWRRYQTSPRHGVFAVTGDGVSGCGSVLVARDGGFYSMREMRGIALQGCAKHGANCRIISEK
jgi:hypothetical protein